MYQYILQYILSGENDRILIYLHMNGQGFDSCNRNWTSLFVLHLIAPAFPPSPRFSPWRAGVNNHGFRGRIHQCRGERDADSDFRPDMLLHGPQRQMPLVRLPRLIGAKLCKVTGNVELLRQFFNAWLHWANPEANSGWQRFLGGKLANHTSHHLYHRSIHDRYQIYLMPIFGQEKDFACVVKFTRIKVRRSMATLRKMQWSRLD